MPTHHRRAGWRRSRATPGRSRLVRPLIVDVISFDVSSVDAPCRVAGAYAWMLAARLDGKAQALVVPHGCIQIRDPVHEMVKLHSRFQQRRSVHSQARAGLASNLPKNIPRNAIRSTTRPRFDRVIELD